MDGDSLASKSLALHKEHRGKLFTGLSAPIETLEDLQIFYTPGVAEPCKVIAEELKALREKRGMGRGEGDNDSLYTYTIKSHTVAVVTDGSSVLGLGNISSAAGLPVMEGKCALFKRFGNVDAFPICIDSQEVDDIVRAVQLIAPVFGGINLEDIAAPKCFEVERRLIELLDIPVFHDDQHGTAIVTLAGLLNALKVTGRSLSDARILVNGAGAAGTKVSELLLAAGAKDLTIADSKGVIFEGREEMNSTKVDLARQTNPRGVRGGLREAIAESDVFIGVSRAGLVDAAMVSSMRKDPIVFAMANPVPEIMADEAYRAGAAVVATGRSDFPNQLNNVLVFPGVFRGALDHRVRLITTEMKLQAARNLAAMVKEPRSDKIIPSVFEEGVAAAVAEAIR